MENEKDRDDLCDICRHLVRFIDILHEVRNDMVKMTAEQSRYFEGETDSMAAKMVETMFEQEHSNAAVCVAAYKLAAGMAEYIDKKVQEKTVN